MNMKKVFALLAAISCVMAMSAKTYTCHLKVTVNDMPTEQDEVLVEVNKSDNTYDLSLKNFCLVAGENVIPVGNIAVSGVEGVDQYGYTTIKLNAPVEITAGDDPAYAGMWLGPNLGEVPLDLTARFTDTAMDASIDIEMPGLAIGVSIFGIAPTLKGDVNDDNLVNIGDINTIIGIILGN